MFLPLSVRTPALQAPKQAYFICSCQVRKVTEVPCRGYAALAKSSLNAGVCFSIGKVIAQNGLPKTGNRAQNKEAIRLENLIKRFQHEGAPSGQSKQVFNLSIRLGGSGLFPLPGP